MPTVRMIIGDVRDVMSRMIADGDTFDLLVTSPPFLALRSYLPADHVDKTREIGSEPTPATFLDTLYGLTADWGRLLPEWASICVELGDTMSGAGGQEAAGWHRSGVAIDERPGPRYRKAGTSGGAGGDYNENGLRGGQDRFNGSASAERRASFRTVVRDGNYNGGAGWPLSKSMCILPHAYTLGLAYGLNPLTGQPTPAGQWRIRNVITWARPNPPVGSLGKRNPAKRTGDYKFRPACSYITVACRGTGRFFDLDAVRTESVWVEHRDKYAARYDDTGKAKSSDRVDGGKFSAGGANPAGAPPLDWHADHLDGDWLWKLATAPYPGAHYATYPLTLPRRLILAMCPESVCSVCGWPRERVTAQTNERYAEIAKAAKNAGNRRTASQFDADGIGYMRGGGNKAQSMIQNGEVKPTFATLGFTDCGHDAYRPGRVLDPFAGSGTTAVAAALEGRDCTLIDLDPRNVELVDRRLREAMHVTLFRHDERAEEFAFPGCQVLVWHVEAPLPAQREQVDGQTNLFEAL